MEKAVTVDWNKWEQRHKEEKRSWPHCHFTPMEYIEDTDGDGWVCESSSGYECNHCGHTKPIDWKPSK